MKNFFFFIIVVFTQIISAQVSLTAYCKNLAGDEVWVRTSLKITNSSEADLNLNSIAIKYYLYELGTDGQRLDVNKLMYQTWWYDKGELSDVEVTFNAFEPPFVESPKKANIVANLHVKNSVILHQNETATIEYGIHTDDWRTFNKSQHYSYKEGTDYSENPSIVVSGPNGIIYGIEPGNSSGAPRVRIVMNWIGDYDLPPTDVLVGDVYYNKTLGQSFIYAENKWNAMGSTGFWAKTNDGISYTGGKVNADVISTNSVEVKDMVTTPRWKIKK